MAANSFSKVVDSKAVVNDFSYQLMPTAPNTYINEPL
jgi:hypothetical protein